jgi:branched-chain amino acid transport system ATP-binding protein
MNDQQTQLTQSAVDLKDVTVQFGGVVALDAVTFTIQHGEMLGLIGPNGAGKTTLLNVLAGAVSPIGGEVVCFGQRVNGNSAVTQARLGVARTFQQLSLLSEMSVRDHVLFGYFEAVRARQRFGAYRLSRPRLEALADTDDSPLAPPALLRRLGLESVSNQLAAEQSVGTARLVDLARALATRPRLLLLDEPVSGLAEPEAEAVADILQGIRHEHHMTVLVVEHNMQFARSVSDRMVALDFGAVIAEGSSDEVLGSRRLREAYFGMAEAQAARADTVERSGHQEPATP